MTNRWSSLPRSLSSQWVSSSWRQIKNAVCSLTKSFAGITREPRSTWRRLRLLSGRSLKEQRSQPSLATSLSELSSIGGPWQNSCARQRRSLSGNPRGSFSLRRRRLAVVHLHMLRLYNGFRTPSPSRAISPSPFRGTPPRNPQAGVGDRGMSAPVVKGPEVGCTVLTTDAHFVPGGRVKKRTNKRVKFTNTAGGIPVHGKSSRVSASWVAGLSGSRPGRGPGKLVCPELGENCARSLGFKCGTDGLSDRVALEAVSVSSTPPTNFQSGHEPFGGYRGSGDAVKRGYRGGCAHAWPIRQQHLLGQQEGRRVPTCDKSEAVESPGPLWTHPDGGFGDSAELCGCRRVSHQVRSEGCIFHSAD